MSIPILNGKRVMLVEDELLVSMLIEDMLSDYGCVIIGPFTTVPDALSAARELEVDMAMLDVNLRGEKIYPVAEVLAERDIPFLLLSGYGDDAIPPGHPQWQACSKPFKVSDLTGRLVTLLGESQRDPAPARRTVP